MNSKSFLNLLREVYDQGDIEFTVRSYSGRGMYGTSCIGIVTDDMFMLGCAIGDINQGNIDLYGMPGMRQDSMGRSTIYYWPGLVWPEGEDGFGDD